MADMVRLQTGVYIMSIGQLEEAFERTGDDSVFLWLRTLVKSRHLLLTGDDGLMCQRQPDAPVNSEG